MDLLTGNAFGKTFKARVLSTFIKSEQEELNLWLKGGLPVGSFIEFGMLPGQDTRKIILSFFSNKKLNSLWVHDHSELKIYPPAWEAYGVDLKRTCFVKSSNPFDELKAVFQEEGFDFIILDSPRLVKKGHLSFLAAASRIHKKTIILIRKFLLSEKFGNPFALFRINCVLLGFESPSSVSVDWGCRFKSYRLTCIRGKATQPLFLRLLEG